MTMPTHSSPDAGHRQGGGLREQLQREFAQRQARLRARDQAWQRRIRGYLREAEVPQPHGGRYDIGAALGPFDRDGHDLAIVERAPIGAGSAQDLTESERSFRDYVEHLQALHPSLEKDVEAFAQHFDAITHDPGERKRFREAARRARRKQADTIKEEWKVHDWWVSFL